MRSEVADGVRTVNATHELESSELLDVAIVVFDSVELTDSEINDLGLSKEIRQAEERYIPIHLKYTMQRTGQWGAVRVVPAESSAQVQVKGTIIHSDGEQLVVEIKAFDARGVKWFEKTYAESSKMVDYHDLSSARKTPSRTFTTPLPMTCWSTAASCQPMKS